MDDVSSEPIQPPSQTAPRLAMAAAAILVVCSPLYLVIPPDTSSTAFQIGRAILAPAAFLALELLVEALVGLLGFVLKKAWRWVLRASGLLLGLVVYVVFIA